MTDLVLAVARGVRRGPRPGAAPWILRAVPRYLSGPIDVEREPGVGLGAPVRPLLSDP